MLALTKFFLQIFYCSQCHGKFLFKELGFASLDSKLIKRYFFSSFILVGSWCQLGAQQYYTNVYFDSTIIADVYNQADCTLPLAQGNIKLDTSLFNYVNGLHFVIVFDAISGNVSGSGGQVHVGDTFMLSNSNPVFTYMLTSSNTTCSYHIKISGTPLLVNQNYPCTLQLNMCTCFCPRDILISADTTAAYCQVGIGNNLDEQGVNRLHVLPNPSKDIVEIFSDNKDEMHLNFAITDITGKQVYVSNMIKQQSQVDLSLFTPGMYLFNFYDAKKNIVSVRRVVKE